MDIDINKVTNAIARTIQKFPQEILDQATKQKGFEKLLYPCFNIELLKELEDIEKIKGIGCGKLDLDGKEELDCLIIISTEELEEKVGIEIKGPSQKGYLLKGANGNYNDSELENCLKERLQDNTNIYSDSHIGDIVKLKQLIKEERIDKGYCIGLLKYTERSQKEPGKYFSILKDVLNCLKDATFIVKIKGRQLKAKQIFISIVEIKKT